MILSKEQYTEKLKALVGENPTDEQLTLLEDMTDTYNDLESRSSSDGNEAWQKKYDELDASWRKRYRDRFFNGGTDQEQEQDGSGDHSDGSEDVQIEDLFIESEGN